jgi:hypothetical protein
MDDRHHPRVSVESQCKARFRLGGLSYSDITVANLSQDGCCIRVPGTANAALGVKPLLEGLELVHPALPRGPVKGRVVWTRPHPRDRAGAIESGVTFLDPPAGDVAALGKYVTVMTVDQPQGADRST